MKFLRVTQILVSESHVGGFGVGGGGVVCWVLGKEYLYQKDKIKRSFSAGNDSITDPTVRAGCCRSGERASDTR